MNNNESNKKTLPFPLTLIIIDTIAFIVVALCIAELFPKHGQPMGLIPTSLQMPLFYVAVAVVVVCGFFQIRILLRRNKLAQEQASQSSNDRSI
jgi:hypothetical protein